MKKTANLPWKDDEVQLLRQMAEEGKSVYRMAAVLGRSVAALKRLASRNGIRIISRRSISRVDTSQGSETRH